MLAEAIAFYGRAFGAEELFRLTDPHDGRIGHAELKLGENTRHDRRRVSRLRRTEPRYDRGLSRNLPPGNFDGRRKSCAGRRSGGRRFACRRRSGLWRARRHGRRSIRSPMDALAEDRSCGAWKKCSAAGTRRPGREPRPTEIEVKETAERGKAVHRTAAVT